MGFFLVCIDIDVYNITRKRYSPVSRFIDLSNYIKKNVCIFVEGMNMKMSGHIYIYVYVCMLVCVCVCVSMSVYGRGSETLLCRQRSI